MIPLDNLPLPPLDTLRTEDFVPVSPTVAMPPLDVRYIGSTASPATSLETCQLQEDGGQIQGFPTVPLASFQFPPQPASLC
jgi:hypothetical protein